MYRNNIQKAEIEDLVEILSLQKKAFTEVAKLMNKFDLPPLLQTIEEVRSEYKQGIILKYLSKENKITIILMVVGTTIIYEAGYYLLNSIILGFDTEWFYFAKILIIEVVYNVLLSILLYPVIQKAGYAVDRIFKRNNVLTRYF